MQPNRVWTLIALAGLAAVTVLRPDRAVHKGDGDRAGSRSVRISTKKDPLVSGDPATSAIRPGVGSAWLLFRTDWGAVLWRVYQKMNENRLLAVAAGVVFYVRLLAVFYLGHAAFWFLLFTVFMADPSTIHERPFVPATRRSSPRAQLNILNEQLTRLTSHRTSALSVGFIGGSSCGPLERKRRRQAYLRDRALNVKLTAKLRNAALFASTLFVVMFTLEAIVALMLALGAVVIAPIVLSHLGSSSNPNAHRPHA